ncbi:hypothetical protein D3C85_1535280 [compost metagenome]
MPHPEYDVCALLNRVDKGIGDRQFNRQLRILVIQTIQQLHDMQTAERNRRVDPHKATNLAPLAGDFLIGGIQQLQHFADLHVIALARIRQPYCASIAIQ